MLELEELLSQAYWREGLRELGNSGQCSSSWELCGFVPWGESLLTDSSFTHSLLYFLHKYWCSALWLRAQHTYMIWMVMNHLKGCKCGRISFIQLLCTSVCWKCSACWTAFLQAKTSGYCVLFQQDDCLSCLLFLGKGMTVWSHPGPYVEAQKTCACCKLM